MNQIFNPYLPLNEYIPDGELHVFGNRVYIYGSHDKADGKVYCEDHYAIWSAPVDDLTDWRYAVSRHPLKDYVYGGTIISNGDIGFGGRTEPVYPLSNNHGGIVQIGERFYIFYHHATNGTEFSRQGCAEEIRILPDGSIPQVEVTSCGLNQGPLEPSGSYPAAIACHITCPGMPSAICYPNEAYQRTTRVTQDRNHVFITDIQDGTVIGYKYFRFAGACEVQLELRGSWHGTVRVSLDPQGTVVLGEGKLDRCSDTWFPVSLPCSTEPGIHALYLKFEGKGRMDLKQVAFR